jgi:hypothetical protein
MAVRKDRPGSVAETVLERWKIQFKRLCNLIDICLDVMFTTALILLRCLFAAEVAVGRRITRRDPEPPRRREDPGIRREKFLQSPAFGLPASLNTPAGRGVDIFGQSAGQCPVNGARTAGGRAQRRGRGYFRCIYSPSCRNSDAPPRFSNISLEDWLKLLNQPPQRRHRRS